MAGNEWNTIDNWEVKAGGPSGQYVKSGVLTTGNAYHDHLAAPFITTNFYMAVDVMFEADAGSVNLYARNGNTYWFFKIEKYGTQQARVFLNRAHGGTQFLFTAGGITIPFTWDVWHNVRIHCTIEPEMGGMAKGELFIDNVSEEVRHVVPNADLEALEPFSFRVMTQGQPNQDNYDVGQLV